MMGDKIMGNSCCSLFCPTSFCHFPAGGDVNRRHQRTEMGGLCSLGLLCERFESLVSLVNASGPCLRWLLPGDLSLLPSAPTGFSFFASAGLFVVTRQVILR